MKIIKHDLGNKEADEHEDKMSKKGKSKEPKQPIKMRRGVQKIDFAADRIAIKDEGDNQAIMLRMSRIEDQFMKCPELHE